MVLFGAARNNRLCEAFLSGGFCPLMPMPLCCTERCNLLLFSCFQSSSQHHPAPQAFIHLARAGEAVQKHTCPPLNSSDPCTIRKRASSEKFTLRFRWLATARVHHAVGGSHPIVRATRWRAANTTRAAAVQLPAKGCHHKSMCRHGRESCAFSAWQMRTRQQSFRLSRRREAAAGG